MHRPTLTRAVQSILNQTRPVELIVVGDNQKSGAGPTRNRAMQSVRTEWVGFLDDDDVLFPNYAQEMAEHFNHADLILSRILMKGGSHGGYVPDSSITKPEELKRGEAGMSFTVKTELARQFPFQNEFEAGNGEDWLFISAIRDAGYKVMLLDMPLYHVRPPSE